MGIVSGGGGGGGGPAAGSYLPAGSKTGVTLDTTTYNDTIRGGGAKLNTLVFATEGVGLAMALAGDAFPRLLFTANPEANGIYMFNGTADASVSGCEFYDHNGQMRLGSPSIISLQAPLRVQTPQTGDDAPPLSSVSPYLSLTSGALSTLTIASGTGRQVSTSSDVETITPVTFNPGAATTATCKVELSPDNVTYSTLGTETEPAGVAFDGTIHLIRVRVPAGWYIKLTVTNATLGTTTYY